MATYHLPVEITADILLRLPLKSLLQCKSVCKNWYNLIKTPDFVASFALNPNHNSTSLIVTTHNRITKNAEISLISNDDGFTQGPISLDFPFLNKSKSLCLWEFCAKNYFSLVGSCHGLVCISLSPIGGQVILCNPLTREFREIPKRVLDYDCNVKVERVSFGFGFHPSARDYKLIQVILGFNPRQEVIFRVDLYAMGDDTWREIDDDKVSRFFVEMADSGRIGGFVRIYNSCVPVVLNGVFYWLARVMTTDEEVIVVSFDMGDEVFGRIRTPEVDEDEVGDEDEIKSYHKWHFTELKDQLSLIVGLKSRDDTSFDVWVLNEDKSSWTHQFQVGSLPRIARNVASRGTGEIAVVGGTKNGELVVADHQTSGDLVIFSYDLMTLETKDLFIVSVPYPSDIHLLSGTLLPVK